MKKMIKMNGKIKVTAVILVALIGATLIWATPAWAKPVISLADCLAIAEAHHPSLAGADGQIAAQRGRLGQTAASDRPDVSGSVSTSRSDRGTGESTSYSAGVSAGVRIYDANRARYTMDAGRNTLSATEEDKRTTLRDIRANVKTSYMGLLYDMEAVDQRLESVRAFEQHLEQAVAFYGAGIRPWFNVTKAEVDLGRAQLALIEAETNVEMSRLALFNAMGIDRIEGEFDLAPISFDLPRIGTESEFLAVALENRSDFRAAELKILAGESTLRTEARSSSPSVSVSGGYSRVGRDVSDLRRDWNIGLSMSIPIVDGGATRARVETAAGQLASLNAARDKLRQDMAFEVRRALADIAKARERVRITELNVVNAEENRRIAMGRYETGAGDALEVADALRLYTEAQLESRRARYDVQLAVVSLEKAIGRDM